jgi:hypothetical protein
MKYKAYLIVDDKIIDTTVISKDDKELAVQLFYEFGHREVLESMNYKIDIFEDSKLDKYK